MRISSQQIFDAGIQALQKHSGDVVEYQRQISSGQRFSKASDSPLAAGLGVQVSLKRSVFTMYKTNQDVVSTNLASTDTQLSSLQNMVSRFQQMMVQASNDAAGSDVRKQLAFQADVLINSVKKFSEAEDANGEAILSLSAVSKVMVAPTIELDSALTYEEVMGRTAPGTQAATPIPATGAVDILYILEQVKSNLASGLAPDPAHVDAIQRALSQISKAQAKTGVLQNELDAAVTAAEQQKQNAETNRSTLLDTDLSEATAGLARSNALLQAVQTVISGMDTNSLFKKL